MTPYFICSLPRSRTAWLANFLSYGPSHCFHEPFNEYGINDLPVLFGSLNRDYVGVSDSISTLFIDRILQVFPEAKLVIIRRPFEEVDKRMKELGIACTEILSQINTALDYLEAIREPLVIDYHDFDAAKIWYFLMPEVPLNRERTKMLENFNVTVPMAVNIRKGLEFIEKWNLQ